MSSISYSSPNILQFVMQADRHRLLNDWRRLQSELAKSPNDARLTGRIERWQQAAERSRMEVEARTRCVPELNYDPELPITAHREALIELIRERQTIVVCGETGSGKSTQLPKIFLEAGLGRTGIIGHTQPRRLAARAVASRLAEELRTRVGELVGFKIRFTDATAPSTLVKLMTDGVLLAETQSDRFLDRYDALIIDEAHERSLNIDFLLGYLRQLLVKRPELKLIITSATIDPQRFAEHYADERGPAPIVEVSGRTYPVEVRYRPGKLAESSNEGNSNVGAPSADEVEDAQLESIADAVDELIVEGQGDTLVFLPTERDIRETAKYLRGHFTRRGQLHRTEILPLYSRLSQAEQDRIFKPHSQRRIVLATNVAESSLTVPGIHYVIDTGLARISRYSPRAKVQRLPIEAISQASADQRAGRCGRIGPGICIRLYAQDDFLARPRFTTPEIRRSDLAAVLLQSLILRLGPLEEFPLLDPPKSDAIRDGQRTLRELGAVDVHGRLTEIGNRLGRLPCDPRVGRMLIEANERGCLADLLIIAAALEAQDVRLRPVGQQPSADAAHEEFKDSRSDFLSYLRLWDFYENLRSQVGRARLSKALSQKFLSLQGFREWSEIIRQLKEILASEKMRIGQRSQYVPPAGRDIAQQTYSTIEGQPLPHQRPTRQAGRTHPARHEKRTHPTRQAGGIQDSYAEIHQSLMAGLLSGVAMAGDKFEYTGAGGLTFALWPGSGLFSRKPKWIMAAEIVETARRYGRTVAEIDVQWVERLAAPLLKHSYSDAHWSRKAQAAMVYQRSTLYGLPIVQQRRVPLAAIDDAMARQLLIAHGLVGGEWNCHEKFYQHNQQLVTELHELAQRTRRRELMIDPYQLEQFYQQRLPMEINDLPTLHAWLKKHGGSDQEKSLWMSQADLVKEPEPDELTKNFPSKLEVGPTRFPLAYRFEPGHAADGVTLTVPQAALRQISDDALGWLVPGLLEEKLLHIIRSLPKNLRRNLVPAPDIARTLASELANSSREIPFVTAACQAMSRQAQERISSSDIDWQKVPEHLRFVVRVVDDRGQTIETSRDLAQLQQAHGPASRSMLVAESATQDVGPWDGRKVTQFDIESVPPSVTVRRGGVLVAAYPTIVDQGNAVSLQLVDNRELAQEQSRCGWVRLFALKHQQELRSQVAYIPNLEQIGVKLSQLIGGDQLRSQVSDLIARVAFVEDRPLVDSRNDWEARNLRALQSISVATQEISIWLAQFAVSYQQLRLQLETAPALWQEVKQDIEQQLASLLPSGFLAHSPWSALREYPRYLQAAASRWEKLHSGGLPKDRKLREPVERVTRALSSLIAELPSPTHEQSVTLTQIIQLLDEFRVSIFAQHLGTRRSVSEKRLLEMISACRP